MADRTTTITLRVADAFSAPLRQFQADLSGAERGLSHLARAGSELQNLGAKLSLIGAPLAIMGGLATKAALDFGTAMRRVQITSGASGEALEELRRQVVELSTHVPKSATELAEGLRLIQQRGFEGQRGMEVLDASARAATAAFTDTKTAAEAISTVLHNYGAEAGNAAQVADTLFTVTEKGGADFETLASSLGQVLPTAQALGIPFKDVGAAMVTLGRAGIDSGTGLMAISRIMISMLTPTREQAAWAKKLGIEWNQAGLQANGFVGTLTDLVEKTGGDADAIALLTGDTRSLRSVLALTEDQGRGFVAAQEQMAHSAGAVSEANAILSQSVGFLTGVIKNQLEAVFNDIAGQVMPAVVGALGLVQQGIRDMSEEARRKAVVIGLALGAGGPILIAVGTLLQSLAMVTEGIAQLAKVSLSKFALMVAAAAGLAFALRNVGSLLSGEGFVGVDRFAGEFMAGLKRIVSEVSPAMAEAVGIAEESARREVAAFDEQITAIQQKKETLAHLATIEPPEGSLGRGGEAIRDQIRALDEQIAVLEKLKSVQTGIIEQPGAGPLGGLLAQFAALVAKGREQARAAAEAGAGTRQQGEDAEKAAEKNAELRRRIDELIASLFGAGGAASAAGVDLGQFADMAISANPAVQALRGQIEGLEAAQGGLRDAMRANQAAMRAAQEELRKLQERHSQLNEELSREKQRLQDLASPRLAGQGAFEQEQFEIEQQLKRLRLAELTGRPVEGTPARFLGMTREQLEALREAGQLQRQLATDPMLRALQAVVTPPKPELTFEAAMAEAQAATAHIAELEAQLVSNEAAIRAQEDAIRSLQAAGQALSDQMENIGIALERTRKAETEVTEATKLGVEWFTKIRPELLKTGKISQDQAELVDVAVRDMLLKTTEFMTGVTDEALRDLQRAKEEYERLVARMTAASSAFAEAFHALQGEAEAAGGKVPDTTIQAVSPPEPTGQQTGGVLTRSGRVVVGELGPEIVHLPGGARVVNAADTAMLRGAGRGVGPAVHVHVGAMMGNDRDAQEFARILHAYLRRERDWT